VDASRCHPYGSGPAYVLHEYVLSVTSTAPGYGDLLIRPHAIGLTSARGRVPTTKGPVAIDWERQQHRGLMEIDLPIGVTATLELPMIGWNNQRLSVNGATVWRDEPWPTHKRQLLCQYTSDEPRAVRHRFERHGHYRVSLESFA